jgi:23S rRNA (guanosine2251-2'-O)-methyltransferase
LCVLLDRVQDPYNFGAMLRSAEVFAADAVFIGEREQVGVTSMVARSSAGAVNRVPIVRVAELEAAADRLRARGLTLVGASEKGEGILTGVDFTRPVAVMIGSEGVGIRDSLTSRCERLVRIPQAGRIGSLNAAVAASIFLYEARRQRGFAA